MAMEVHDAPRHDMNCFIEECGHLFMIDDPEVIYFCLFAFNFSSIMLILFSMCFSLCYKEKNCVNG
jgi:hypothetical protein